MTVRATLSSEQKVRRLAEQALIKVSGDTSKAYELFNNAILAERDYLLERELTSAYRSSALRAWLAETYQKLRAERRIPIPIGEYKVQTTNYDEPKTPREKSWAAQHVEGIKSRIETERVEYEKRLLDSFLVNGRPIGDCTANEVLSQAERREVDARFMRLIASGIPPEAKIRDFVTAEEAEELYKKAHKPVESAPILGQWDWIKNMSKPLRSEAQFHAAVARAGELMDAKPHTWEGIELDLLAQKIKDYEDGHAR